MRCRRGSRARGPGRGANWTERQVSGAPARPSRASSGIMRGSVLFFRKTGSGHATQESSDALPEDGRRREKTDNEVGLSIEVEVPAGLDEDAVLLEKIEADELLRAGRRHAEDDRPAPFGAKPLDLRAIVEHLAQHREVRTRARANRGRHAAAELDQTRQGPADGRSHGEGCVRGD